MKENSGTATLFVKAGDEYVRVTTNVKKDDGSRAIGTILDPSGPAIEKIKKGEAYYGEATILGKPYLTGYEPIRDASDNVIGIYYVGYAFELGVAPLRGPSCEERSPGQSRHSIASAKCLHRPARNVPSRTARSRAAGRPSRSWPALCDWLGFAHSPSF